LDVQTARTVKDWIARLAREQGKTIVLTTHQLDLAQELCHRVAIIRQGRLLTDLPIHDVLARHRQDIHEIRVGGSIDPDAAPWLAGFSITAVGDGVSIRGPIPDQAGLYDLLARLRALNLPLLAVEPVEPSLEEVFLQFLGEA
ncbi:MAG: ABC transporter ATP-binding protein, partial [Chloroflexota bacterium]